jgi:protease YdgD
VAVLTLPAPVTRTVLPLAPARWGQPAMLGGYSQDRAEALMADTHCVVLGLLTHPPGLALRRHSCVGTRGTSGAPLLVRDAGGAWAAAGVQVLGNNADAGGLAVPSDTVQRVLNAAHS